MSEYDDPKPDDDCAEALRQVKEQQTELEADSKEAEIGQAHAKTELANLEVRQRLLDMIEPAQHVWNDAKDGIAAQVKPVREALDACQSRVEGALGDDKACMDTALETYEPKLEERKGDRDQAKIDVAKAESDLDAARSKLEDEIADFESEYADFTARVTESVAELNTARATFDSSLGDSCDPKASYILLNGAMTLLEKLEQRNEGCLADVMLAAVKTIKDRQHEVQQSEKCYLEATQALSAAELSLAELATDRIMGILALYEDCREKEAEPEAAAPDSSSD